MALQEDELKGKGGVYQILNTINGKVYIGSTKYFNTRWKQHLAMLKAGSHHSILLQRSWGKYGSSAFKFSIIENVSLRGELLSREQRYLDWVFENKVSLNICKIAGSTIGYKHSPTARERMSRIQKKYWSDNPDKKKTGSEHHNSGKQTQQHVKEIISATHTGEKNINYGKIFTEDEKENLRRKVSGELCGKAKLTWDQVREMRERYQKKDNEDTYATLAENYNVACGTIQSVIEHRTWKQADYSHEPIKRDLVAGNPKAKLDWEQVGDVRRRYDSGESCSSIASSYNMKYSAIRKIVTLKTWKV